MKKNKLILIFLLFINIFLINISAISEETKSSKDAKDAKASESKSKSISPLVLKAIANPNYLVTVGDVYKLTYLAGSTFVDYTILIDRSYRVRVSNLAVINARGLNFYQLKKQVENIVIKNYPFSGVQFNMISVGLFPVYVTGEVKTNSEVMVTATQRLSEIIKPFLTAYSSLRDVQVITTNGIGRTYDVFSASASGDFSQDPYLRPGYRIKINRAKRKVKISGAVEKPGTYQLLKDENLTALINKYARGFNEFANTAKVTIKRYKKSPSGGLGESIVLSSQKEIKAFVLENHDSIHIENRADLRKLVYFEGALNSKSNVDPVQFFDGDDLISIIRARRTLFSSMSDTKNAYLVRNGQIIYKDFNRIFFDPSYDEKIPLEAGDRIVVPVLEATVTVLGAVLRPGSYPYVPGKTYEYYIGLAGGFDKSRNEGSAVYIKDVAGKYLAKEEHILPNSTITAKNNAFMYNFTKYLPLLTTTISIISITLTILNFVRR